MDVNVEAYKEWINLYSKEAEFIWLTERKELRVSAMLLKTVEKEFKRIQDSLNMQFSQFRDEYETFEKHKTLLSPDNSGSSGKKVDAKNFDLDAAMTSPGLKDSEKKEQERLILIDESMDVTAISSPVLYDFRPEVKQQTTSDSIPTSPKINKEQKYHNKRKSKFNALDYTISSKSIEKKQVPAEGVTTPKPVNEDDDLINCTVIDGTPVMNKNIRKTRTLLEASKKRNISKFKKSCNNSTLTQMFADISNNKVQQEQPKPIDISDVTFCDEIDMQDVANENVQIQETKNCDTKKKREVICKDPVVRGKARQKLEGWDCECCQDMYKLLADNTQDRKALQNLCSKHRATRKPLNNTPPGHWSFTFPPTQETVTEQSVDSILHHY